MMTGVVTAALQPVLRLTVHDASGQAHQIEALIDTGFNGFLLLPSALIAAMGLPWLCRQQGQLGDGSFQVFDVYTATVLWDNQPRVVEVEATAAQPLIGMELMRGYALRMDIVPGGVVSLTTVP
jgi:clan AA aspartic protease